MSDFSTIFAAQEAQLIELRRLLQLEQDLLILARVDGRELEAVAKSKQQCLDSLSELETARQALQQASGYGISTADTERMALDYDEDERWDRLQTLHRQTSHLNHLNGTLIMQRMLHNQRVLEDLRALPADHRHTPVPVTHLESSYSPHPYLGLATTTS